MKSIKIILGLLIYTALVAQTKTSYNYVNPFIGTDDMGHTFPGASVPFGLVQLSPDTDTAMYSYGDGYNPEVYRYCSGYQYKDETIVGFSHTHFNGTGHSDLGDFLIMPATGDLKLNPGTKENPDAGYRSRFRHETESAQPGYYTVKLDDYNITAELTASEHSGFHKYNFPPSENAHVILDLVHAIYNYDGKVVWSSVRVENDTLVTGYRQTNGWARERTAYFAMSFSLPVESYGLINDEELIYKGFWRRWNEDKNFPERAGHNLKCYFNFDLKDGGDLMIKFALSGVSTENAIENMNAEIPTWDFDEIKNKAKEKWEKELSKITIEASDERKINFYTSMYHSFLNPSVFSDVNGEYRGLDKNIHHSDEFTNYTIFSLWDTYRALHPLYTIIQQKRTNDIINSMLAHYEQSVHKILPVWSHWANENWCMIGYHAVPVIVDAYMKGIRGYDAAIAFEAVTASANYDSFDGIGYYKKCGFVPEDFISSSASKTLEYAYDDWTIYKFAELLGKHKTAAEFKERAGYFKNLYDKKTGFIRAKNSNGGWKSNFDATATGGQGYIEGNAWNYSLYVPHDIKGFIDLLGGDDKLVTWLDSLFIMEVSDESISHSEDVTRVGMIGNYVHGNEPSHHVPYMYNYAKQPWKTQERIHQIVNTMYKPKPDGLCGNDDCGQMSAWYIFSSLGFYPVAPGSNEYVIGSPCVNHAVITLENGNTFVIEAENLTDENIYIQSVELNGVEYNKSYLLHEDITNGGKIIFRMGSSPNKTWGVSDDAIPYSMTE
ncbi:MAG: GH92 family glycosyl hydrolase [Melioribacteraceae bacterium]|nr:GH92 family glycosyl hydrolase [Melioribacteraceae bacterium]MCF8353608.1 GH92 family glycosyl hydrolase [Melioribacteraceae bacterium]MCF8393531.1 GH92 family glycosyl hydrolase [Melioribacteraceae bacterium]MCF8419341.1 GH92 family glycosyl hydrolase [Melioribacteraceae bacterium]